MAWRPDVNGRVRRPRWRALLVGALGFACVLSAAAAQAQSEDGTSEPEGAPPVPEEAPPETLIVTATSQTESVQEVAVSALAFSEVELKEAGITDISGLADYTPNLEIKTGASKVSNPTIFIRGIGLLDFNSNAASSVAIFNDGVYQNSPLGQLFQFYDVENVEVLRGPQGTVHARNATAGAIRIAPRKPNGTYNASLTGTLGNYGLQEVEAAMGVPIVEDLLSARLAARWRVRDGYTKNRCGPAPNTEGCERIGSQISPIPGGENFGPVPGGLPDEVNNEDNWAARVILRLEPTFDQDWTLNVGGGQSRAYAYQFQSRGIRVPRQGQGIGRDDLGYADEDRDPFAGAYDLVEDEELDLFNSNLTGTIDFDAFSIETITGYSQVGLETARNFDASPNQLAHVIPENDVWQATQSLRFLGSTGADFEWEIGGMALYEELDTTQLLLEGLIQTSQLQEFTQETATWAAYARGSYYLTDWLRLDAGARYNWERKIFELRISDVPSQRFPNTPIRATRDERQGERWTEPTGEIVLTWLPTDFVSVYGRYTHGFKGGHFNGGAFFSAQLIEAVQPEKINAYEAGIKSRFFDGRMTLNAAVWYYDYSDYQVFALQNTEGALPLSQLLNAPRVESRGVEVDLEMRPTQGLRVGFSMALLKAVFSEFTVDRQFVPPTCFPASPPCPPETEILDFSGNPLVASPPLSLSAIVSYDIDLGRFGVITPRVDASYRDKTYFTPGDQSDRNLGPNEGASQDPYWLLNLRLGYRHSNFEVAGWIRNATDEVYLSNSLDVQNGLGKYLDVFGAPRTYGVTASVRW